MLELIASTIAFTTVVALGLAVLAAVTLVPFLLALQLADRRGFPSGRWGALALVGAVLGLGVALLALRSDGPALLALLGLPVCFLAPGVLSLLEPGQSVGGRTGRHA